MTTKRTTTTAKSAKTSSEPQAEPALDMDALLASDSDKESDAAEEKTGETPEEDSAAPAESSITVDGGVDSATLETDAQRRIRELQEELAKPAPDAGDDDLTEEERLIRDLEDQVARKKGAENAPVQYDTAAADGEKILLHFLEDGFTIAGAVWYRGQEVEFTVGTRSYEQQKDRNGKSWLDLVNDTAAQYKRWGKQVFAPGPWPGKKWGDVSGLSDPEEIRQAEAAAAAENRRARQAPLI